MGSTLSVVGYHAAVLKGCGAVERVNEKSGGPDLLRSNVGDDPSVLATLLSTETADEKT